MENAFYITQPGDLAHFEQGRFSRIYFGAEFCDNLIPTREQLASVQEFARNHSLSLTLVTPVCRNRTFPLLEPLLGMLAPGSEVVFNDWGILSRIRELGLVPVHGRIMCSIKKDPRIGRGAEFFGYFRSHNYAEEYLALLRGLGVSRVEIDNVPQGFETTQLHGMALSIYYPFVVATITRKCIFANMNTTRAKFLPITGCGRECGDRVLKFSLDNAEIHIMGNAQFYINTREPGAEEYAAADRLVFMPAMPNRNNRSAAFGTREGMR